MSMSVNPAKFYSSNPATLEAKSETKLVSGKEVEKQIALKTKVETKKSKNEDFKVDISEQSKELKQKLSSAQKAQKIQ